MNQEIIKDIGGTLTFDPPQPGRPSSATVTLLDSSGSELAGSQAATVDSVNTTLSSNAAAGATSVVVASVGSIVVGRRYVLSNLVGQHEWVRVRAIDTGATTLTLATELAYAHPSTSTFVGNQLSVAITAGQSDELEENDQASWVYAIAGVTYRTNTFFDVVRSAWSAIVVTPWQFKLIAGDMAAADLEALESDGLDFADEIQDATRRVRDEVISRGYRPSLFRSFDQFTDAICQRALLSFSERGEAIPAVWQDDPAGWLDIRREVYADSITTALHSANYDANEDEVISEVEAKARLGSKRVIL